MEVDKSDSLLNFHFFLRDLEAVMEEVNVRVGVVQWGVISHSGLGHLLRVSHDLFTKVSLSIKDV